MQDHLDAGAAGSSFATTNFSTFRALLRLARTLLRNFYPLLGPRSGTLVQALLAGGCVGLGGGGVGGGSGERGWAVLQADPYLLQALSLMQRTYLCPTVAPPLAQA